MALLNRSLRLFLFLQLGLGFFTSHLVAQEEEIYCNVTTYSGEHVRFIREYGEEINFAGSARTVTSFRVEYRANFVPGGDEEVQIYLYRNDGPAGAPGSLIFSSGWVRLHVGQGIANLAAAGFYLNVPEKVTLTLEFRGLTMEPGDEAGMLLYDPPTIGSSEDFLWMRNEQGEFERVRWNDQLKNNLGLIFTAIKPVPAAPALSIRKEGETIIITSQTQPGFNYHLERKSALDSPNWQLVQSLAGAGHPLDFAPIPTNSGDQGSFRVVVE